MRTRPGEVWLADLGIAVKTRPVVIISREDPQPPRQFVLYVPLTTKYRESAYEVKIGPCHFSMNLRWPMFREWAPFQLPA